MKNKKTINTTENLTDAQKAQILLQVHKRDEAVNLANANLNLVCLGILRELGIDPEKRVIDLASLKIVNKAAR
jgi:hypothetical protein